MHQIAGLRGIPLLDGLKNCVMFVKDPAQAADLALDRHAVKAHADGDMFPPSRDQFSTFLVRDLPFSRFYEFRLESKLLAVAVTDLLPNGLSAVYTFYEPAEERRSLGRFGILWQISESQRLGLEAVYLGYWIKNCKKMNYKKNFHPYQLLIDHQWKNEHEAME